METPPPKPSPSFDAYSPTEIAARVASAGVTKAITPVFYRCLSWRCLPVPLSHLVACYLRW